MGGKLRPAIDIKKLIIIEPNPAHVLSVAGSGSVLETFYQKEPFYSGRDLFFLKPKITLLPEEMLYYCSCIKMNQRKYSYGRQANRTLKDLQIPSPDSIPDWVYGSMNRILSNIESQLAV